jgi:tRNA nucleotidyltransferase (CCA-adding enzyme)
MNKHHPPVVTSPIVLRLARAIRDAGGRALLIGGVVRDSMLFDKPADEVKDFDLEVFGIEPARLRELLDGFGPVAVAGDHFRVYKLRGDLDVSIPRRSNQGAVGESGLVEGDPQMSIRDAAGRRDFTVNSISYDPLTEELFDFYGGLRDIDAGVLRMIHPVTFAEDPLRALRGAQFVARFCFEFDGATAELCRRLDLSGIPVERLREEWIKLLVKGRRPELGISTLQRLDINARLFPELAALRGVRQSKLHHPEGDVMAHTERVVRAARRMIDGLPFPEQLTVMLAALCHDFGKPATTEFVEGDWRARGHEEAGVRPTLSFLDRIGVGRVEKYDVRTQVAALVADHLKPAEFARRDREVTDAAYRRLSLRVNLRLLHLVSKADLLGRATYDNEERAAGLSVFIERARSLEVEQTAPRPLISGKDVLGLGVAPGPEVGRILRAVYEQQLDGKVGTSEEALAAAFVLTRQPPGGQTAGAASA